VNATACEDRGADLFLWARGAEPGADLAAHVAACAGCRADLERLRPFAAALPAASEGLAPLAATRVALLRAADLPPALPPRTRPGPLLRVWAPLAALAASAAVTAFVLVREFRAPRIGATVEVATLWGGTSPAGAVPGVLTAKGTTGVHLGSPLEAEVVLGEGTTLRLSVPGADRTVELVEGLAWFDPAPPVASTFRVRAGGLEVDGRGARFTVERRGSGAIVVYLEAGVAVLRSGGGEVTASGPCRIDVPAGGRPGAPQPAEPSDATGWFARPEVLLERAGSTLVITLRPEVPRELPIAPFDRFDPLFSFRAERPGRPPRVVEVKESMLVPPLPPQGRDGAFLISGARSYKITVDAGSLGLEPGTYALSAVYAAHRVGGLWRGIRSSKPMEFEAK
jgi:hypothetical protein